jgi:hypothetical protein
MTTIRSRIAAHFILITACFGANRGLPLVFEPNHGQAPPQARFLAAQDNYSILLMERELVLKPRDASPVTVRFLGATRPRAIQGQEPTSGVSNYIFGFDQSQWHTNIPNFASVRYAGLYPGTDLVFHSDAGRLEYDFVVAPGADSRNIQLEIEGTSDITEDGDGNLLLHAGSRTLLQAKPVVYQELRGGKVRVDAQFVLTRPNHVAIRVADYDRSKPLVIDPVISFSATLASSGGSTAVALDPAGNVYLIDGSTPLAPLGTISVTKLDPTLSTILYSTHFGPANTGSGNPSIASGITVDSSGDAYVIGSTNSPTFPTTPGAYQTIRSDLTNSTHDAFLTKLNSTGAVVYSTYLGGNSEDEASSVAVDASDSAYVAGSTESGNFPTTPGAYQQPQAGMFGAFVTKFKPDGSGLVYSTFMRMGFTGPSISSIALDSGGNAYLGGVGTASAVNLTHPVNDGFVAKLNPTGTNLVFSKLIGGIGDDFVNGIAVDNLGNVYIAGTTTSTDFPTTPGAFQTHYGGGPNDAFSAKLSPDGATVLYSTYLGGSGDDRGAAIALNSNGNAIIGGSTSSVDFPVSNALQSINPTLFLGNPSTTAFVAKLDGTGAHLIYSTYLGGHIGEDVRAMALDQSANAYVTGITGSSDFPVTTGTIQMAIGPSGADAFLTKITDPTTCTFSTSVIQPNDAGGSIFVTAPPGCFWYAVKADSWVTFGATTSGSGNGTVTYTLVPNSGPARRAAVSVAGQKLTFMQASTCTYMLDRTVTINLGLGTFFVNTQHGCTWTATSNASWFSVSPSGVQTDPLGVEVSASPNPGLQPRVGTITFQGIDPPVTYTLTVTQPVAATTMSVQPYELDFGTSGTVTTDPQTITVTFSGPSQPSWTASSDQPNIKVSPTSGVGNAVIQVSVSAGFGQYVTINAPGIRSVSIPVRLFNVTETAPFGSFDTPADNTTGVAGAIPVTGWALDNIEVTKVDIWRESVNAEPPGALVYIGDATFVDGVRTDLLPKYPFTPLHTRGGWGYLLLTNFLPNTTGAGALGNGTYKLHAIAHNKGGMSVDLGTRTITVDNIHAFKPFGTIDTPAQGGTASGNAYVNFGWALTQNSYMIPTDGSTINVFLDGVPVGHPTYNQFRSDIASLFPGLANSNGAVGFYYIDTTTLTPGLHTISWSVVDDHGRADGIGSRYFIVLNSNGPVASPQTMRMQTVERGAILRRELNGPQSRLEQDDNGVLKVEMQELERIELELGAYEGHLLVAGEKHPLPIGSTLKDGVFYWQAGLGFLGDYELVFRRPGLSDLHVAVSIQPKRFQ